MKLKSSTLAWFVFTALCLVCLFACSGCDATHNAVFQPATVSAGVAQQDSVQINGQLIAVTPEMRAVIDPAKIIKAGTAITEQTITVTPAATAVVQAVKYLPIPYADLASYALNGLLGIAAVWLTRRKSVAEKVNVSLVRGVDTFRDILDQTEGGQKLDRHLTQTLGEAQRAAGIEAVVRLLLERYATPAKPHHSALTSAALK